MAGGSGDNSLLLRLPTELIFSVADFCTPSALLNLVCCNKYVHGLLYEYFRRLGVTADGGRAVLWATQRGDLEFLKFLHHNGADLLEVWASRDYTAGSLANVFQYWRVSLESWPNRLSYLDVAASQGQDHIVSWLIDNGVDVNQRALPPPVERDDFLTHNALVTALWHGRDSTAKLLIERGAAVGSMFQEDSDDESELMELTVRDVLRIALSHSAFETAKLVLSLHPGIIDVEDGDGLTLLGEILLNKSLDTTSDPTSERPGFLNVVRLVLTAGASLRKLTRSPSIPEEVGGVLPLHLAILEGDAEAALLFLDAGADATVSSLGYQPLHLVFSPSDYLPVKRHHKRRWQVWNASRAKVTKALLAAGADPNGRAFPVRHDLAFGMTPTVINGVNADPVGGVTPLMYAAANGTCLESIAALLECGADINALDDYNQSALHWAVSPLYQPHVRLELEDTPWLGPKAEAAEVCRLLLENGCYGTWTRVTNEYAIEVLSSSKHDEEEKHKVLQVFSRHLVEDEMRENWAEEFIIACLRTGDFAAISTVKQAEWCKEIRFELLDAALVKDICEDFPIAECLVGQVVEHNRAMIRFAEDWDLIHLSQAKERDDESQALRDYLLAEEAKAAGFILDYPFMFPRLSSTTDKVNDNEDEERVE